MTIKELFKKVETLNKINEELNTGIESQVVVLSIDDYDEVKYHSYEEFIKDIENEWNDNFVQSLIKARLNKDLQVKLEVVNHEFGGYVTTYFYNVCCYVEKVED